MLTFSANKSARNIINELGIDVFRAKTNYGREWMSEVVFKALEGKIAKDTNIDKYGFECDRNEKKAKAKVETGLLTSEEIGDGLKGADENIVASYNDENIEYIIEVSEVPDLVDEFLDMHEYLCIEEGIDLWKIIMLIEKHNAISIEKLRYLVKEYNMEMLIRRVIDKRECMQTLHKYMDGPISVGINKITTLNLVG